MSEAGEVKLEYAMRGESPIHISDFEHLRESSLKDRPADLICAECSAPVTCVLPKEAIADHYRHLPGSGCALGSSESAAHFNAKLSLAHELNKFRRASLVYQCRICHNWYPFVSIGPYDRAVPELKVESRRPDITCLRGSSVVGMAEILHSHAVDFEKKNELNALGHPWFEIPAVSVHPQFFKFIEAADVLSIDAAGAGLTYPTTPDVCVACAPREALMAANWRELERRAIECRPSSSSREFDEWERLAAQRRATAMEAWKKFKSNPPSHLAGDLALAMKLEAAGVIPEMDEYGLRPSTPGIERLFPGMHMELVVRRNARAGKR